MSPAGEPATADRLDGLLGRDCVVDAQGHRLGRLRDVYDDGTGQPAWVAVTHGPNRPIRFVPLHDARVEGTKLRLNYPDTLINTAPETDDSDVVDTTTEHRLRVHYGLPGNDSHRGGDDSGGDDSGGDDSGGDGDDSDGSLGVMIRSEERLAVATRINATERVLLHTYLVVEEITRTFTVRRQEIRVEHLPLADPAVLPAGATPAEANRSVSHRAGRVPGDDHGHSQGSVTTGLFSGSGFSDEVAEIVLYAEVPVLQVVPVETVRVQKHTVTTHQTVAADLNREHIELERSDDITDAGAAASPVGRETTRRTGTDPSSSTGFQTVSTAAARLVRTDVDVTGSHAPRHDREVSWKDNLVGNARSGRVHNVSWGSIFAGVVTFLAIAFVFSLLTAAFGLDGSGTGAAIVSIIGILLAFFGGGAVAGAMAVRGGLVHGFLTCATSIVATVVLVVVLTLSTAGAVGGVLGSVLGGLDAAAGPSLSQVQPAEVPHPTAEQPAQAEQAQQAVRQAADASQTGATWGFFGLLLGAVVASVGGLIGSRSVNNRKPVRPSNTGRI